MTTAQGFVTGYVQVYAERCRTGDEAGAADAREKVMMATEAFLDHVRTAYLNLEMMKCQGSTKS